MNNTTKTILTGLTQQELQSLLAEMNEPSYRAQQLHHWIYIKSSNSFDQMTNVSKSLKLKLADSTLITDSKIAQRLLSKDGTIKYLVEFHDGQKVETVLMRFDNRPNLTACISTQVGCSIGCGFCATGNRGFVRNLTASEMIDQVLTIQRDTGLKVSNVVFMGQGEPLLNYENLSRAILVLNKSMEISMRRITVSTAGIIPVIAKIAQDFPQVTLAVSLHAANSALRKQLIPLENKYPLLDLISALRDYYNKTHRRVTIEYVLIKDVNDDLAEAKSLNNLLKDLHCNINLIPYNSIDNDSSFSEPSDHHIKMFKYILELGGRKVTVRLKRGNDILAACGQLSGLYSDL